LLSFLRKPTVPVRVLTYIIEIVQQILSYVKGFSILHSKSYPGSRLMTLTLLIRIVMKKHFALTLLCLVAVAAYSYSQDVIRQRSCANQSITLQVDSLKKVFEANGFMVLKEASMSMESEYEMPVLVPMTQGAWYHIVFIGDPGSKLHEVRMYDYDEKQVYYKKLYGYTDGNIISYGYQPKISEWHMIKPVQVNKSKKDCCGYILLLKKVKGNLEMSSAR
jgi:hypothetical protein